MEATLKTLATKDALANLKYDLGKCINDAKADTIKWMLIFLIGEIAATLSIVFLFLRKQ